MSDAPDLPKMTGKRKRVLTQRALMKKMPRVYSFKRIYNPGTLATVAITPTLVGVNFSLNDIPGYLEFTNLFDYYKITGIRAKFIPYQTQSNSTSTINNASNVPIFFCVDTSDNTPPLTVDELTEFQDCKISNLYSGFDIYFKPKFADATAAARDGWVACSNPSLNYYGLKYAIPATANAMTYYLIYTFYVSFKDPK